MFERFIIHRLVFEYSTISRHALLHPPSIFTFGGGSVPQRRVLGAILRLFLPSVYIYGGDAILDLSLIFIRFN